MDAKYKIAIPKPCHEDWNKMTVTESGRFCGSCAKNVVDFTNMNPTEIQSYFIANQEKNICGRFKNQQLDSIIIKIPSQALFSQIHFHKLFLLALLISMGTTLFSCVDKNGNKQKIDGVEVVKDAANEDDETLVGIILPHTNDSLQPPLPPKPKINEVKFAKPTIIKGKIACKPVKEIPYEETIMGKPALVSDTITK
jgi:hypothetical protein